MGDTKINDKVLLRVPAKRYSTGGDTIRPWDDPIVGFIPGHMLLTVNELVFHADRWYPNKDLQTRVQAILAVVPDDRVLQLSFAPRLTIHPRSWSASCILWDHRDTMHQRINEQMKSPSKN